MKFDTFTSRVVTQAELVLATATEDVNQHRTGTPLQRWSPPRFEVEKPLNRRVPIGADRDPTKTLIIGLESMW
jgi:hypothetical protein